MRKLFIAFILCLMPIASKAFDVRAFYIDCRTQVMTLDALKGVADKAAAGGMNTLLVEWEATFPFEENFNLRNGLAYTRSEVDEFIAYCSGKGLEVIPLQNCFGHCEYILRHERFRLIREDKRDCSQVCPLKIPQAKELFTSIFREIAEAHPSQYIHIGADETRLLGHCKDCQSHSKSELFVDYIAAMSEIIVSLGKTPVIWADMILQHPEALDRLPKNIILVDWNYGWSPKRFGDVDALVAAGYQMWGATALRSSPDDVFLVDWKTHFSNLDVYVPYCRERGFTGLVQTSWSTSGQYGYTYDNSSAWEVIDMQPIREVYPMKAFDVLQMAFCEAALHEDFDAHKFAQRYAREHFALNEKETEVLMDLYFTNQKTFMGWWFQEQYIAEELDFFSSLLARMQAIHPKKNKGDWQQYLLMLEIRVNYLSLRVQKVRYETMGSNRSEIAAALKPLLKEAGRLQRRFAKMNSDYLKDPERAFGHWSYVTVMRDIYDSVK